MINKARFEDLDGWWNGMEKYTTRYAACARSCSFQAGRRQVRRCLAEIYVECYS